MAAHDRAAYRGRVIVAATAILITGWILYTLFEFTGRATAAVGQQLFAFQAWGAFIFACGAFTATSDSISHEKRDGTLGLLFLTTLKGQDVILGKLISGLSLFVVAGLATLPILTLSLLLGGVQLSQCFNLLFSLLSMMLLSAAAGLFASSISVTKHHAGAIAVIIILFFCIVIPLIALSLTKLGFRNHAFIVQLFTPLFAHQLASGSLIGLQLGYFWTALAIHFSFSCALLAAASWITPRTWQQRAREPLLKRLTERHAAWTLRTIKSRSTRGRAMLDRNAYEWLASRKLSAPTSAWTFIAMIVLLGTAISFHFMRNTEPYAVLLTVSIIGAYILQINAKIRVGGHACDRFVEDRESGAMELILSTPMTIRELVTGEFRALRRHFIPPLITVAALLFLALYLSLEGIDHLSGLFSPNGSTDYRNYALLITACAVFLLALDSLALAWAGIWCSIAGKPQKARGSATALVLVGPFILLGAILTLLGKNAAHLPEAGFLGGLALVVIFVASCNVGIIAAARQWIHQHARARLTEPQIQTRDYNPFAWILKLVRYRGRMRIKRATPPAAAGSV